MKKKMIAAIGLAQVLLLASCGAADAGAVTPEAPVQQTEEESTVAADAAKEGANAEQSQEAQIVEAPAEKPAEAPAEAPAEEKEPEEAPAPAWKDAYLTLLREERDKVTPDAPVGGEEAAEFFDCYWLYDINKDGTPELILRRGDCEAAYHGEIYTFADDAVKLVADNLGMGHMTYETDPGENGIVSYWGHMGYGGCSRLSMTDDGLKDELLFEDDINERIQAGDEDAWYKPASDVIPGAYYLMSYDSGNDLPVHMYEEIEAAQTGKAVRTDADKASYPRDEATFFDTIIKNGATVEAIPSDMYTKYPGRVPFTDLLNAETLYEYGDGPLKVNDRVDTDLNGDGKLECVLYLDPKDEEWEEGSEHAFRIVLSEQDGRVYAYVGHWASEKKITEDGCFVLGDSYTAGYSMRILFDRSESVFYSVPEAK